MQEQDRQEPRRKIKTKLRSIVFCSMLVFGLIGTSYLSVCETVGYCLRNSLRLSVLNRDIPAYYQIQESDLIEKTFLRKNISSSVLQESQEIVGRYTINSIPRNKPINENLIIDGDQLFNMVAIAISATPDMTFGQKLQIGDFIDITLERGKTELKDLEAQSSCQNILVLDINDNLTFNNSSNLVIGLPKITCQDFIDNFLGKKLLITRNIKQLVPYQLPQLTITQPSNNQTFNAQVNFSGEVDIQKIENVKIWAENNNFLGTANVDKNKKMWSFSLLTKNLNKKGTRQITIKGLDKNDHLVNIAEVMIIIDSK